MDYQTKTLHRRCRLFRTSTSEERTFQRLVGSGSFCLRVSSGFACPRLAPSASRVFAGSLPCYPLICILILKFRGMLVKRKNIPDLMESIKRPPGSDCLGELDTIIGRWIYAMFAWVWRESLFPPPGAWRILQLHSRSVLP